jgi:hypothetical protein
MSHTTTTVQPPATWTARHASQVTQENAVISDLRFMQDWETNRLMHPGVMLRARQIQRASRDLVADKATERPGRRTIA